MNTNLGTWALHPPEPMEVTQSCEKIKSERFLQVSAAQLPFYKIRLNATVNVVLNRALCLTHVSAMRGMSVKDSTLTKCFKFTTTFIVFKGFNRSESQIKLHCRGH